jgi:hypothetical protein
MLHFAIRKNYYFNIGCVQMPLKIISGGQTGADQGGLFGARDAGFPTGGYAPSNFYTENGPRPALLKGFGLVDSRLDYIGRTRLNARNSDFTIWFGNVDSPGGVATKREVLKAGKIFYDASYSSTERIAEVLSHSINAVNIAGNRESHAKGICKYVRGVIKTSLELLKTYDNDLKSFDTRRNI